jgi:hypothetical protein
MVSPANFRVNVELNDLLMRSSPTPSIPAKNNGLRLPEPVFPQFPENLADPGPETPPERRKWTASQMAGPLSQVPSAAGRFSSHYGVFVRRIQMQSGLLVLPFV